MGQGIELVAASLSDAAATGAQAMTAANQQSFNVRATAGGSAGVSLEALITSFQDVGSLRVRSPRLHDDVNGIRIAAKAGATDVVANEAFSQRLYSQDALTVEAFFDVAPTAAHLSVAGLLVYYDDIPGINANLKTWAEIEPNVEDYLVVPVNPTNGTANWGAGVAINAVVDVFKANKLYALLGVHAQAGRGLWSILGVDVGNLFMGGPFGTTNIDERRWFRYMEQETGKPSIPVINSQNKGATTVQTISDTAAAASNLSLIFAQLSTQP